jgi:crotonobetainyl-CoA:carnitine CoA-transferase CaiB-like acyl-CoA transferase
MTLPLAGTLVVSIEQAIAAPLASRKLADAGARVIKVERPEGDFARGYDRVVRGACTHFVWANRGKESVVLDLKKRDDAELLQRMIARADVFLQNLAPGAAARAGFGAEALRRAHPRLITVDVSGYGETGPYAEMKAYDNLVQGETGLQSVTGTPESPSRVGISICDIAAGMHVYAGILEALLRRAASGEGASLKVSLFDAMSDWMSVPYLHWRYGGKAPERMGLRHSGLSPYGPFESAEGDVVLISVQNEREWLGLCEALGLRALARDPRFAGNPSRVANRDELELRIQEVCSTLSRSDLVERLRQGAIAFGRVNTVADFAAHPQLRLTEVDTAVGAVQMPAQPVVWAETPQPTDRRAPLHVPELDEHGEALRAEFGGTEETA